MDPELAKTTKDWTKVPAGSKAKDVTSSSEVIAFLADHSADTKQVAFRNEIADLREQLALQHAKVSTMEEKNASLEQRLAAVEKRMERQE